MYICDELYASAHNTPRCKIKIFFSDNQTFMKIYLTSIFLLLLSPFLRQPLIRKFKRRPLLFSLHIISHYRATVKAFCVFSQKKGRRALFFDKKGLFFTKSFPNFVFISNKAYFCSFNLSLSSVSFG